MIARSIMGFYKISPQGQCVCCSVLGNAFVVDFHSYWFHVTRPGGKTFIGAHLSRDPSTAYQKLCKSNTG